MDKPNQISSQHHRSPEQIKADYGQWLEPIARDLRAAFGGQGYYGLEIKERGQIVYSWTKPQPLRAVEELSLNRDPHKWTDPLKEEESR